MEDERGFRNLDHRMQLIKRVLFAGDSNFTPALSYLMVRGLFVSWSVTSSVVGPYLKIIFPVIEFLLFERGAIIW